MNSNWSCCLETPNLGQIPRFLEPCDLEIWCVALKNNRAPLLCYFKLYASLRSHQWIQAGVTVRKRPIWVKIDDFFSRVTLQFDVWPWKTIGHLFYATSSFVHHFVAIGEFKLELQSGNAQFGSNSTIFRAVWPWNLTDDLDKTIGQLFNATSSFVHHFLAIVEFKLELQSGNAQSGSNSRFLEPCDLEIWRMTLKNNRAPLLCCFQLCAWFHCHMWIQTGVRVRKRLSWVLTSVTLTFDLWPWPFAWTSLLTIVITPENFMMIQWWEHGEKGVTDRRTDRQTDGRKIPFVELLGRS